LTRLRTVLLAGLGAIGAGALTFAIGPAVAQPAAASVDQALVSRASTYLQGLNAAQGRFVQTDARGRVTQGTFYLKRPGKIRFEYDKPSGLLIVSDGANVKVQDQRLKTFDSYPLSRTPLRVFLSKDGRFDQSAAIERVARTADGFSVTARDAKNRKAGAITLVFSDSPMRLKAWTVVDAQGRTTHVALSSLTPSGSLADSLFVLRDPRRATGAP
jgi:outer membrane lipoprotein-sorting protein